MTILTLGVSVIEFVAWHVLFGALHEVGHVLVACLVGCVPTWTWANFMSALTMRKVHILTIGWETNVVRNAGWMASLAIAWLSFHFLGGLAQAAASLTALEAFVSDGLQLLGCSQGWFGCGNFGLVLLNAAWASTPKEVKDILETMVEVTMMRGAQSGGVVTYAWSGDDLMGLRARVVNQKRTCLSELVRSKLNAVERWAWLRCRNFQGFGRIYAGHTRFATSSKATFEGTHPHQWSPPETHQVYVGWAEGQLRKVRRRLEVFITHNGDLDFFDVGDRTYDLSAIQSWLERATGHSRPCDVDSVAIAGLMDMLRTQGCLVRSVRFGFHFGPIRHTLQYPVPPPSFFQQVASCMDKVFQQELIESKRLGDLNTRRKDLCRLCLEAVQGNVKFPMAETDLEKTVHAAVSAFFDNDLLYAMQLFMGRAKGSFGLCVTSSLDADRQLALAARGQTISVAFYPESGLVLYGSEASAVKAAIGKKMASAQPGELPAQRRMSSIFGTGSVGLSSFEVDPKLAVLNDTPEKAYAKVASPDKVYTTAEAKSLINDGCAMRLDLDDLGGEICLLDWGSGHPFTALEHRMLKPQAVMRNTMTVTLIRESLIQRSFRKRLLPLEDNPMVQPLPKMLSEPVGQDIKDIPDVLKDIQTEWKAGGVNRSTAWAMGRVLRARLQEKKAGRVGADAVDLLITGCEVSLWLGEQLVADLGLCFKHLVVKSISANKILGMNGLDPPMPQVGHACNWELQGCVVLLLSHSGGTFATLNVSNLLQAVTKNLFVVTSEWDTQIGKQLRQIDDTSRIFNTGVGLRPAEPCSLSVAAMHQLLTQILVYIAATILEDRELCQTAGAVVQRKDLAELERCNGMNISALAEIVGQGGPTETVKQLRGKGRRWAQHVLEGPRAWILCALYIFITVTLGQAPVTLICEHAGLYEVHEDLAYAARALDALLYIFLPQLSMLLIRLVQRRPLLHRMTGRTVVIGDVPWVAQSAEAFLSKLVACSYSAASLNVLSGNPADHLVHRMTHRVVRGTLLACGRPDGRLISLSGAEQAVCLAVNQASSIQSMGETCESLTIGHNPFKLPLAEAVFLKGNRPKYLFETASSRDESMSPTALLGEFSNFRQARKGKADEDEPDWMHDATFTRLQHAAFQRQVSVDMQEKARAEADTLQLDADGHVSFKEFERGFRRLRKDRIDRKGLMKIFERFDTNYEGALHPVDCKAIYRMDLTSLLSLVEGAHPRVKMGLLKVQESVEEVFGEQLVQEHPERHAQIVETQFLSMHLYESRIASLQRAVAFFVMFHEMGKTIANFWPWVSFGLLRYRMDRTHSIMRIATTASPVSGAEVRQKMVDLKAERQLISLQAIINKFAQRWRAQHAKRAQEVLSF
ncbi:unnamed protein product [Effrenium voratum]|uniref:Glutamine amidotransferase type-2 domain-containing protein n=1 Tax=Effrenium voratum TaxID=2562239 RepID=A0AA36NHD1_9DINO|nr:unnamed protein product [Effrenium voratum]CAJ1414594.1 unnamed protein product [Effrenium voratum]